MPETINHMQLHQSQLKQSNYISAIPHAYSVPSNNLHKQILNQQCSRCPQSWSQGRDIEERPPIFHRSLFCQVHECHNWLTTMSRFPCLQRHLNLAYISGTCLFELCRVSSMLTKTALSSSCYCYRSDGNEPYWTRQSSLHEGLSQLQYKGFRFVLRKKNLKYRAKETCCIHVPYEIHAVSLVPNLATQAKITN